MTGRYEMQREPAVVAQLPLHLVGPGMVTAITIG
jgi:hypothetical protein